MAIDSNKIKYDYFTFDGAISKAEYQRSFLILFLIGVVVNFIAISMYPAGLIGLLISLIRIILIVAMFSITIRRLRDLGHSGWVSLLLLIPLVNLILIIYLLLSDKKTIV